MKARYAGQCAKTGHSYPAGTEIVKGAGGWEIADPAALGVDMTPAPIRISQGSGYGDGFRAGQVLRHKRADDRVVVVVRTGSSYYSEDGWSFGVGDDEGYVYWAECREATPDESAPVLEAEEQARARRQQRADYERLFARAEGEYLTSEQIVDLRVQPEAGTRLKIDGGFNIYGGGTELLVQDGGEWVWMLVNNGMDGDDWSRNNWGTGGAGAIAYRFALTPERLSLLRSLPGGEAIGQTREERRRDLLVRLRDRALAGKDAAAVALFGDVPEPAGVSILAIWAEMGGLFVGMTPDRSAVYLRAGYRSEDDIYSVGLSSSDNASAIYLRFAATPERVEAIRALWPDWVENPVPGRYFARGPFRYVSDNAADILRAASSWRIPVNGSPEVRGMRVTPGVTLVSLDSRVALWSDGHASRFGSLGLEFWSEARRRADDARRDAERVAKGEKPLHRPDVFAAAGFPPIPALQEVPALPEPASRLVQIALSSPAWREGGRYRSLLDVVELSKQKLDDRARSGPGWGETRTLERVSARHADGREQDLYLVTTEWGSMGEDGDGGEERSLFETEADARAELRKELI